MQQTETTSHTKTNILFSVVIPTLGGTTLLRTIEMMNAGTQIPHEILICIPHDFAGRVEELKKISNVKILATECKGQVKQRIEGFKAASCNYVIQLDDDMYVHPTCFENLVNGIVEMGGNVAIAPALIFEESGKSCYEVSHHVNFINTLIHGKDWNRPGSITRTGINIGLNALLAEQRFSQVDWLAGGGVIHRKEDLVTENFYPFTGKAFYEDVMHSIAMRKKDTRLFIDKTAICGIDDYENVPFSFFSSITQFHKDYRYRKQIVTLQHGNPIYLFLDGLYMYYLSFTGIVKYGIRYILNGFRKK
jgi:glycosyltransferase involved in cell wall biosynthesis